ncbi:MAG TPA: TonB C-terminal domain-containing protein [Spirochaetota bacterium]|nr:TonB C-terminal domain-containing protein [Spirochaetota bacterium]
MNNKKKDNSLFSGRDIIVNTNQDDKRDPDNRTLLSDRDSTAKGFITREQGDRWLNNSLEFKLKKGLKKSASGAASSSSGDKSRMSNKESEIVLRIYKSGSSFASGSDGMFNDVAIPDKNSITLKNAIYYSNSGMFSFNTAKFKNFNYFKSMKDKIASNWYPPLLANANIGGYNAATGSYTPGSVRIMAIPGQKVKLYFIMNRSGDIQKVDIVDSYGNKPLDESCLDAIRLSKSFGKVPDDIKGEFILIPFIFGYYTQ